MIVLSISIDDSRDKEKWFQAVKEDGMTWPQLSDLRGSNNVPYKLYGITTIPANILIDPYGIVLAKDLKRAELQAKLAELLAKK